MRKKMFNVFVSLTLVFTFLIPSSIQAEDKWIETLVAGVPVFTMDNYSNLTDNMTVKGMVMQSRDHLVDHYDEFDEFGVIYRGFHTLTDNYGNSEDTFTYVVYYSPETIERINFDNWDTDLEVAFEVADASYIHPVFSGTDFYNLQKPEGDDLPQGFDGVINGTHVTEGTMGMDPEEQPDLNDMETKLDSVDKIGGRLNEKGKKLLNNTPLYEEDRGDHFVQYLLVESGIYIVTVDWKDPLVYSDENIEYLLSVAEEFMEDDAEYIGPDEDARDLAFLYTSEAMDYNVEITGFDGELFGVAIGETLEHNE